MKYAWFMFVHVCVCTVERNRPAHVDNVRVRVSRSTRAN